MKPFRDPPGTFIAAHDNGLSSIFVTEIQSKQSWNLGAWKPSFKNSILHLGLAFGFLRLMDFTIEFLFSPRRHKRCHKIRDRKGLPKVSPKVSSRPFRSPRSKNNHMLFNSCLPKTKIPFVKLKSWNSFYYLLFVLDRKRGGCEAVHASSDRVSFSTENFVIGQS